MIVAPKTSSSSGRQCHKTRRRRRRATPTCRPSLPAPHTCSAAAAALRRRVGHETTRASVPACHSSLCPRPSRPGAGASFHRGPASERASERFRPGGRRESARPSVRPSVGRLVTRVMARASRAIYSAGLVGSGRPAGRVNRPLSALDACTADQKRSL